MARKGGLGKGLEALFQDNQMDAGDAVEIKLSEIEPNKQQPRKDFDENALASLADSIKEHGVIQPLLVRPLAGGTYQIVAGERRWRASRMAGLQAVPVIIREMSDQQAMEIALIENLQREDLNSIEEALGYQELMDTYQMTQEQVSDRVGKSRSAVANALRLLNLPEQIQQEIKRGRLSAGQGRTLLAFDNQAMMMDAANLAIRKGVSVRELERMAKKSNTPPVKKNTNVKVFSEDHFYKELEISLRDELHRKVKIDLLEGNHGVLKVDFYNQDELLDMAYRLANLKRKEH